MIRVVKVNTAHNNFTRYMGRCWAGLPESIFHNPFHVRDWGHGVAIEKFAEYWYAPEQSRLRCLALELIKDGEVLGCWCRPLACHCDIIVGYLEWKRRLL